MDNVLDPCGRDNCFYGTCKDYPSCGACCSCIGACIYAAMNMDARNEEEEN